MKEYFVSFVVLGSFNNEFRSCFLFTDAELTEKRITYFRDKISAEIKMSKENIVILGVTLLDKIEG